jgi:hypothetical protein
MILSREQSRELGKIFDIQIYYFEGCNVTILKGLLEIWDPLTNFTQLHLLEDKFIKKYNLIQKLTSYFPSSNKISVLYKSSEESFSITGEGETEQEAILEAIVKQSHLTTL